MKRLRGTAKVHCKLFPWRPHLRSDGSELQSGSGRRRPARSAREARGRRDGEGRGQPPPLAHSLCGADESVAAARPVARKAAHDDLAVALHGDALRAVEASEEVVDELAARAEA